MKSWRYSLVPVLSQSPLLNLSILILWGLSSAFFISWFLFIHSSSLFSQKASGTTLVFKNSRHSITPRKFFPFLLKMVSIMGNDGQQPYNTISNFAVLYENTCLTNENTQECNKYLLIQLRKNPAKTSRQKLVKLSPIFQQESCVHSLALKY